MNAQELKCVIECDPAMRRKILGVYARDKIPAFTSFPCGLIANTDTSDLPGKHWVGFYYESKDKSEFFDSCGHSPEYFGFRARNYNEKRLQSSRSNVCGQYCLYYLLNRCRGVSMPSIFKDFSDNLYENDAFIFGYISKSYPYCFNKLYNHQSCFAETNLV